MLIPDFYTVQEINFEEGTIDAEIRLNPKHEVYEGHFPGQPVVPGVIQLQIVKEILEGILQKELFIHTMSTAKYLKMITPEQVLDLQCHIRYKKTDQGDFSINATISSGEIIFTKLRASLSKK